MGASHGGESPHWWVLLLYRLSTEPSARRVYVWRKLKRLGAVSLQDAVWALPLTPWTVEQFQWLAVEIREMEGSAMVWEAQLRSDGQDEDLVRQFRAQVEATYRKILTALATPDIDRHELIHLSHHYQQTQAQDYFHSSLGLEVRDALERLADQIRFNEETGKGQERGKHNERS